MFEAMMQLRNVGYCKYPAEYPRRAFKPHCLVSENIGNDIQLVTLSFVSSLLLIKVNCVNLKIFLD